MTITPQNIQKQKFSTKFRGFDIDEVDMFLEEVAENFLELIQENKKLKEQTQSLEKNNAEYESEEQTFKAAIISAQKVVDEMKESGQKEAEELVAKAQDEAKELVTKAQQEAEELVAKVQEEVETSWNEANGKLEKMKAELDSLTAMRTNVRNDLKTTLENYMNYFNTGEFIEETPVSTPAYLSEKMAPVDTSAEIEARTEEYANEAEGEEEISEKIEPVEASQETIAGTEEYKEETKIEEEEQKGLDEATLAEMFQNTDMSVSADQRVEEPADDDEYSELFQKMDMPGDDEGESRVLEELSSDLLFSDQSSDSGTGPAVNFNKEEMETGFESKQQVG